PRAAAPSLEAVTVTGVTAHEASVGATIAAGSTAAAWWIEFGATTAYGQMTAPVALAARSAPRSVTGALSALSAATAYHARIVVASSVGTVTSTDATFTTLPDPRSIRIAAAGDIACDPDSSMFNGGAGTATECHELGVSDAILAGGYDAVLPLGDVQYDSGTAAEFAASYQPSWGRLKAITHPAVGNHEYGSPGASPYFQYFGAAAGSPDKGYYSYDLGSWHLIVINSNCVQIGGCSRGSPQEVWLTADLAAHPVQCTLAYWHHPRFSSGQNGDAESMDTIWGDLYAAGADVVLNGHDHDYERFAPQNAEGQRDDTAGIREFVVGTGGKNHMTFKAIEPNSEVHDSSSFGFLDLTLSAGSYAWRFVSDPPGGFADSGSGACH
ncbi:MAG: metallophosphoesterase, partial [Actinomycetota bacterium]|nr:metallophosphoesterase [Actinomycetota bacterium]